MSTLTYQACRELQDACDGFSAELCVGALVCETFLQPLRGKEMPC
jgi:hypothetical protein